MGAFSALEARGCLMAKANRPQKELDFLQLQALFDEELTPQEQEELRAQLAETTGDDSKRLDALAEMRELLRFQHEAKLESETLDLWPAIRGALDLKHESAPKVEAEPRQGRFFKALSEFFGLHKVVLVPAAVIAVVMAIVVGPQLLNEAPPEGVVETERTIVIVEPLRFEGQGAGAVSYTPESQTPVIWYLGEQSPSPSEPAVIELSPEEIEILRQSETIHRLRERLERLEKLAWPRHPINTEAVPSTQGSWQTGGTL